MCLQLIDIYIVLSQNMLFYIFRFKRAIFGEIFKQNISAFEYVKYLNYKNTVCRVSVIYKYHWLVNNSNFKLQGTKKSVNNF